MKWTEEELLVLKKYYPVISNATLAQRLKKNQSQIAMQANRLGLHKENYGKVKRTGKKTSIDSVEKLKETIEDLEERVSRIEKQIDRITDREY